MSIGVLRVSQQLRPANLPRQKPGTMFVFVSLSLSLSVNLSHSLKFLRMTFNEFCKILLGPNVSGCNHWQVLPVSGVTLTSDITGASGPSCGPSPYMRRTNKIPQTSDNMVDGQHDRQGHHNSPRRRQQRAISCSCTRVARSQIRRSNGQPCHL